MTNLEWLEKIRKEDEEISEEDEKDYWRNDNTIYMVYRQAKALEIIAEELCLLNKNKKE